MLVRLSGCNFEELDAREGGGGVRGERESAQRSVHPNSERGFNATSHVKADTFD